VLEVIVVFKTLRLFAIGRFDDCDWLLLLISPCSAQFDINIEGRSIRGAAAVRDDEQAILNGGTTAGRERGERELCTIRWREVNLKPDVFTIHGATAVFHWNWRPRIEWAIAAAAAGFFLQFRALYT
jgi:hypothetical protein